MEEEIRKKHHVREDLCTNRPKYRDGRKLRAIKVYTINQESQYLLVQGVPSINVKTELQDLFSSFGEILSCERLENYPTEEFTEVFLIKFARLQSARFAKKFRDDYNFYGGVLHVCYAPEYESVDETWTKLEDRRKSVIRRINLIERQAQRAREEAELDASTAASGDAASGSSETVAAAAEEDAARFSDENPVVIELPEEFFLPSEDDLPSPAEHYQQLPPPPSVGQTVPFVYPSQLTNPMIVPHDLRLPNPLQPSSSYMALPR